MLVRLKNDALKQAGIHFTKRTLWKRHSIGEHPEIFLKMNHRVFIIKER